MCYVYLIKILVGLVLSILIPLGIVDWVLGMGSEQYDYR